MKLPALVPLHAALILLNMLTLLGLITAAATAAAIPLEQQQQPLAPVDELMPHLNPNPPDASTVARPLAGRFLHITGMWKQTQNARELVVA